MSITALNAIPFRLFPCGVLVLALAACETGKENAGASQGVGGTTNVGGHAGGAVGVPEDSELGGSTVPEDDALPTAPGDHKVAVNVGGLDRRFVLHLPPAFVPNPGAGKKLPVLFVFHGANQGANYALSTFDIPSATDPRGWIVVFGEGYDGGIASPEGKSGRTWNVEYCCGPAAKSGVDDLGYFDAVLERLESEYAVDSQRIYATGFSNGAMFTHRLAAERPWDLAAAVPVAGCVGATQPGAAEPTMIASPDAPMPISIVHGTGDKTVPFDGGSSFKNEDGAVFVSAETSRDFWLEANTCADTPTETKKIDGGQVLFASYTSCADPGKVNFVTVKGGLHKYNLLESHGLSTPEAVCTFLELHSKE